MKFTYLKIKFLKEIIAFYNYQIMTGDYFFDGDDDALAEDYENKVRALWSVVDDIEKTKNK